jgi:hypothetical protein
LLFQKYRETTTSLCSQSPSQPKDLTAIVKIKVAGSRPILATVWKLQFPSIDLAKGKPLIVFVGSGWPVQLQSLVVEEDFELVFPRV